MQVNRPSAWKLGLLLRRSPRASTRRGVSILEVLFAIAVTTIGLLGAIAVFPVASAQARKGRISDALAVAGMSAAHDFDVRGMRQPANWVAFDDAGNIVHPLNDYLNYINSGGGSGKNWFGDGRGFCLDPRYIAANSGELLLARTFPASMTDGMPRITLVGNITDLDPTNDVMGRALAEAIFTFEDDLTFGRPDDRSQNAYQVMDTINGTDFKRQSDGHMSWMATIVPLYDRNNVNFKDTYVLSIVVFYDRPIDQLSSAETTSRSEYGFTIGSGLAAFPSSGLTGGEVVLKGDEAQLNALKQNDWIMLIGAHLEVPRKPIAKWYRIVDAGEAAFSNGTNFDRHVTLFGQDWDPSLETNAVYAEGVVGVFEKTIRLDLTP